MNGKILDREMVGSEFVYQDDLKAGERLKSMLLDHFIICFTILPPVIIPELIGIQISKWLDEIIMLLVFGIYLNKDFLRGRSPAKRILGQVVIDKETELPADGFKCVIRNFTDIFWIFEVIIVMFNPNRRIGDLIAGTKVVRTNKEEIKSILSNFQNANKLNWILSLGIAMFYIWIIFQITDSILFV
jgi:uncharacterized RDD family membrane protein YckC